MSREIRRVATDFVWPLKKVWQGYLMPDDLCEAQCPDCKQGYSQYAQYLIDLWWGYVDFDPRSTGSVPFTPDHPKVRAFAERNVRDAPAFFGGETEVAIVREAERLLGHWNGQWAHHLSPADVAALIDAGELRELTHTWVKTDGRGRWVPKDPPYSPTAAEVNDWSLARPMGMGSSEAHVAVRARYHREGFDTITCPTCGGHGSVEKYPGQRADADNWESTPPPAGDGWQVWETTSEGSPISPVFTTREQTITFLMSNEYYGFGTRPTPLTRQQAEAFVGAGHSLGSVVMFGDRIVNGDAAVAELNDRD